MMEPRRLLEEGATGAARALLDSARADGPPAGAAQRMFVALQGLTAPGDDGGLPAAGEAPAPASSTAGGPLAAPALKAGALAKAGLVGLLGLGVLGGGALVHRLARQPSVPLETAVARPPATPPAEPVAASPALAGGEESPAPAIASPTSAAPPSGPEGALRNRGTGLPDQSLSAEIRVLDVARAALDAHRPAAAQRALASYSQRFPQGHLRPEATVLRLAVLVQQGQRAAARALAAQLLASQSYRAYEQRIRALLREAGGEQASR